MRDEFPTIHSQRLPMMRTQILSHSQQTGVFFYLVEKKNPAMLASVHVQMLPGTHVRGLGTDKIYKKEISLKDPRQMLV